jgi:hypothetical protein
VAKLGIHGHRFSGQFQKTLQLLTEIQSDRQLTEHRDLANAAGIMELCQQKGLPWDPAERWLRFFTRVLREILQRPLRPNDARRAECARFECGPPKPFTTLENIAISHPCIAIAAFSEITLSGFQTRPRYISGKSLALTIGTRPLQRRSLQLLLGVQTLCDVTCC